jgi:hypothetical protein
MKIYIAIISIAFLSNCNLDGNTSIKIGKALPFEDTLIVSKVVALDDDSELLRPLRIKNLNDNYLIISELLPQNFLKVFKLPEAKFLFTWGTNGGGPNEFRIFPTEIITNQKDLIIYDLGMRKLRTFEFTDSTLDQTRSVKLSYKDQLDPLNRIQRMNDTLYFVNYGTSIEKTNKEHVAIKPNIEDTLFTFGEYPDSELKEVERSFKFQKTNLSNPDGSLFATFYLYQNKIKIYNNSGEIIKHIDINDNYFPSERTDDVIYRSATWSSDKFMYVLGFNRSNEDLYENPDSTRKTSIEIFDWKGNQVYRAKFDRLINAYTVSEKHSKIYAYSVLEPQKLFIYDLPKY